MPEIADGVVEIKACAREPGHRTKIAVWSNDPNVDPVGACVGARGARVRMVVNELRGEKIDIVPFSEDPPDFVIKALSPAKVKEVRIDDETGTAEVIVPDYQLSLAIGKEGQNARLAARLTGWRVDIKSETQLAEEEAYAERGVGRGRVGRSTRPRASRCGSRPRAARPCRPRSGPHGGDEPDGRRRRRPRPTRPTASEVAAADDVTEAGGRPTWPRSSPSPPPRSWPCTPRRSAEPAARPTSRRRRRTGIGGPGVAPIRTCIGCRRRAPPDELVRVVRATRRIAATSAVHCRVGERGCAPARPRASSWPGDEERSPGRCERRSGSRPSRPWPRSRGRLTPTAIVRPSRVVRDSDDRAPARSTSPPTRTATKG